MSATRAGLSVPLQLLNLHSQCLSTSLKCKKNNNQNILNRKFGISSQLSEQYLVDCNRNDMTGNWGCNGGSLASAYMNIQYAPGIPSGKF